MTETRRESREQISKKRRRIVAGVLIGLLVLGGAGAWTVWSLYENKVRQILGLPMNDDFQGQGTLPEIQVTINPGDYGDAIAKKLVDAGVTKSFDAVYRKLLADSSIVFTPGVYALKTGMSADAALAVLKDAGNRVTLKVTIPEGTVLDKTYALLAKGTGIPVADFKTAGMDPTKYGISNKAPSLEGFLFPATYEFNPSDTAVDILTQMVNEMNARLTALGVAEKDRYDVVTFASIVQRESGSVEGDFAKVARVFQNRLDAGWKLQSDATVAYGTGHLDTVWTTAAERADGSNKYNTYVHGGLPVGPIGAPGDVAIKAVLKPTEGPWFFFVPVNLKTGETVFSETEAQHSAAVAKLHAWCNASKENAAYCG
jgi:UPF0755 protein